MVKLSGLKAAKHSWFMETSLNETIIPPNSSKQDQNLLVKHKKQTEEMKEPKGIEKTIIIFIKTRK